MPHRTRDPRSFLRVLRHLLPAIAVLPAFLASSHAHAQRTGDLGMMYTQERTKFVGASSSDYFYLRGATVDLSYNLWKGIGVSGSGTGLAATNVRGSIDIQHIQFLAGPRYTFNLGHITDTAWNRRGGIFVEGKVGYTIAPAGLYPTNGVEQTHASSITYAVGAGINYTIYHRFDLRLIEGGLVRTELPNGGNNIQNTLRLASGINFHFGR